MASDNEEQPKQNIAISRRLVAELKKRGSMGDTYDDVIWRLLQSAEDLSDDKLAALRGDE